jgi:hypothetical protein
MQVLSITGERACRLVEKPTLQASGDFVVVKVLAAPLCTEYKAFVPTAWDTKRRAKSWELPRPARSC